MIVTGNRILDALDFLKETSKTLEARFTASLYRFEDDEETAAPRQIAAEFAAAQSRIAQLQELQAAYNLRVEVDVLGETMTLQRVLQQISSANKLKSMWTTAAQPEQANPYQYLANQRTRDKDNEYARRVVPIAEAQDLAAEATRTALAYKQAVRSGNSREVEMDVAESLFE